MAGGLEALGSLADIAEEWMPFTPQNLWDEFKEGQARDEARQVRASDIERDEKWLERNSISGRISEGMRHGLSLTAAAGVQPGSQQSSTIGQDSGYLAMNRSGQSANNKTERLTQQLLQSQIDAQNLQNLKLFQELEHERTPDQPAAGDSFMPGGSQSIKGGKRVIDKPLERTASYPGSPHMVAGAVPGVGYEVTPTGLAPIPSQDAKQGIEDSPYELRHFLNYGILPNFGIEDSKPPKSALPKGAGDWEWSIARQEWQPYYPDNKVPFYNREGTWMGPLPKLYKKFFKTPLKDRIRIKGKYPEGHLFHRKGG